MFLIGVSLLLVVSKLMLHVHAQKLYFLKIRIKFVLHNNYKPKMKDTLGHQTHPMF